MMAFIWNKINVSKDKLKNVNNIKEKEFVNNVKMVLD